MCLRVFFVVDRIDFAFTFSNRDLGIYEVDSLIHPSALPCPRCLQHCPRGEALVALEWTCLPSLLTVTILMSAPHDDLLGLRVSRDLDPLLRLALERHNVLPDKF